MLNERLRAAQLVSERLFALEKAIDDALVCAAELTQATSKARRDVKASTVVGQEAVVKTGETIAALYEAQNAIIDAHGGFAQVRDQMRIPVTAHGDEWKDVPFETASAEHNHLKAA